MNIKALLPIALTLTLAAIPLRAETLSVDPAHSAVRFEIRHLFSTVPGRFNEFESTVTFDQAKPEDSSVEATIQIASIDTGNEKRDGHLKAADFFDAEKFPTLTFKSTKISQTGEKTGKIEGDLTLHGVTKPVTLDVEYLGMGKGMQGETRAGFNATTTINRKDFGLTWSKVVEGTSVLGDEVKITVNVEATVAEPEAAAAP